MSFLLYLLFLYFSASTVYVLVLSVAGLLKKRDKLPSAGAYRETVILIPAYKEDAVIVSSVKGLLQVNYPKDMFDIVVIADSLQPATLIELDALPIKIVEVAFEKSTKAKALNQAMAVLKDEYEIAVISDADNIPDADFLKKINDAFNAGHSVVQGMRVAKNLNTPYAILDAYSEVVNNHLFRKGANALKLSSALIGSGMAFNYKDLKDIMRDIDAVGGFDRMLQLKLVERGSYIYYHEEAVVYDEKVASPVAIRSQRKRWNASQYKYLKKYFFKGFTMLMKGNFSYFNLSVLGSIFLSRVINLGVIFLLAVMVTIFPLQNSFFEIIGWVLFSMYALALILPVSSMPFKVNLFKASLHLPYVFLLMLKSAFSMRGADHKFIHTPHCITESSNSLKIDQKNE